MSDPMRPSWDRYRQWVSNEQLVAATAVLDVDPAGVVRQDATAWLTFSTESRQRDEHGNWHWDPVLDWEAWVSDVETQGRGWSSNQWRLYDVAAGLAADRPFNIVGVLDRLSEWRGQVWRVLVLWGTGADAALIRQAAAPF
ncbi:hypothetical protein GCM10009721_39210 [Terrabacter tumescens]|uniref:Uncharacterized protein n=1 Tax=Terrabacter tumescens TaxID=60443 RepID=A0ABQ2IDB5_9MICO|nr:hypothetical protein [Terrabacter tumescens]GGN07688.1 hypothetical protein GCM10009721_39210 [Terrabacter tumescens]